MERNLERIGENRGEEKPYRSSYPEAEYRYRGTSTKHTKRL
jgi:hypothetical protein